MLDRRVVTRLIDTFGDFVPAFAGFLVLVDVLGGDHARRITGARRGDGIVKRVFEIIFEPDDGFWGESYAPHSPLPPSTLHGFPGSPKSSYILGSFSKDGISVNGATRLFSFSEPMRPAQSRKFSEAPFSFLKASKIARVASGVRAAGIWAILFPKTATPSL